MTTTTYKRHRQKCAELKQRCPLPVLLQRLGLGHHARSSCRSPFRDDQNASWGIYQRHGRYQWKDLGTGDGGDEITFLARIHNLDQQRDFLRLVDLYQHIATGEVGMVQPPVQQRPTTPTPNCLPDCTGLTSGTLEQLQRLSELRTISLPALQHASDLGFLVFGCRLNFEVFGVRDSSGLLAEVRRLDGRLFPPTTMLPERKSHTLKHSTKSWPLGIGEAAPKPSIMLVEGLPDFLAAFDFIQREGRLASTAPVAMLSASSTIQPSAMELFSGKKIRIFPHNDQAGFKAAERWSNQLRSVATSIDYFAFNRFAEVNDLADLNAQAATFNPNISEVVR